MAILSSPRAATEKTRRRYDRIAPVYDRMEGMAEQGGMRGWRRRLWSLVPPGRVLEVGVGTGRNAPFYPPDSEVTAIDLSPAMLARARRTAKRSNTPVNLRVMDVQHLEFPDGSFDAFVTSCVFCSVPDPVAGFSELRRVLRPRAADTCSSTCCPAIAVSAGPCGRPTRWWCA